MRLPSSGELGIIKMRCFQGCSQGLGVLESRDRGTFFTAEQTWDCHVCPGAGLGKDTWKGAQGRGDQQGHVLKGR